MNARVTSGFVCIASGRKAARPSTEEEGAVGMSLARNGMANRSVDLSAAIAAALEPGESR